VEGGHRREGQQDRGDQRRTRLAPGHGGGDDGNDPGDPADEEQQVAGDGVVPEGLTTPPAVACVSAGRPDTYRTSVPVAIPEIASAAP
jgi:hypothetical protein